MKNYLMFLLLATVSAQASPPIHKSFQFQGRLARAMLIDRGAEQFEIDEIWFINGAAERSYVKLSPDPQINGGRITYLHEAHQICRTFEPESSAYGTGGIVINQKLAVVSVYCERKLVSWWQRVLNFKNPFSRSIDDSSRLSGKDVDSSAPSGQRTPGALQR